MFDPASFLDTTLTDANSTQTVPVPVGEFIAVIDKVECRSWQSKKDPSKSGLTLDITWSIDDAGVRELLGRDKVTARQGIMLDLTDAGGLDMGRGRNVGLGRLREALNLNIPGQPFAFSMLVGRVAKVKVEHRIDGEQIFAEIKQVARV